MDLGARCSKSFRAKILVFGGRADRDSCGDIAQMINARTGSPAAESFAGRLALLETAAAMDYCTLVVSNDTGLMHLAAARKRKVLAIFGSTVKEFGFFPYGTESHVVETPGLPCRPCSTIGLPKCPEGHFRCMKDIQADMLFAAAQQLLGTRAEHSLAHDDPTR